MLLLCCLFGSVYLVVVYAVGMLFICGYDGAVSTTMLCCCREGGRSLRILKILVLICSCFLVSFLVSCLFCLLFIAMLVDLFV